MADIFQRVDELETEQRSMIAERLEFRAAMPRFVEVRDDYLEEIGLPMEGQVLELGCGTGAVCRAIATWPGFKGKVTGSDLSESLIETARELAVESGIDGIEFIQADGQGSTAYEGEFDMVLGHTVISHVADPDAFLAEALRLARPGGKVVIHDADYASLSFDTGTPELDRVLPQKYSQILFANPFVMRELPGRLRRLGVRPSKTIGALVVEVGGAEYFPGIIRNYAPTAVAAGVVSESEVTGWVASLDRALAEERFFGSCNYLTYAFERPA